MKVFNREKLEGLKAFIYIRIYIFTKKKQISTLDVTFFRRIEDSLVL